MAKEGLVNCKKCGTLFFKTSERDICEECYRKELDVIDGIKKSIKADGRAKVPLEELPKITGVSKDDIEDLITRGRLFAILPKVSIKCKFCGVELEDSEKTGFTCKNCLMRFSPEIKKLKEKGIDVLNVEKEAKNIKRRLRGGINSAENSTRYGFIQNYDL